MEKKTSKNIIISGNLKSGMGKGKFFMGQDVYRKQFVKKLGIDSYRGTLNLKLNPTNSRKLAAIKRAKGILVKGFKKGDKTFGEVLCYRAEISGLDCALVIPKLSQHTNVAEMISSKKLRSALNLKEGSLVKVTIKL